MGSNPILDMIFLFVNDWRGIFLNILKCEDICNEQCSSGWRNLVSTNFVGIFYHIFVKQCHIINLATMHVFYPIVRPLTWLVLAGSP